MPLNLPEGYTYGPGRDEFGARCITLRHEHFGDLSDHTCEAEAIYAAQEHAEELAQEADENDRSDSPAEDDARVEALLAGAVPAPAMVPQQVQQQQADAGKLGDPKAKARHHHPKSAPRGGFIVHRRGRNRGDLIGRVRPTEHPTLDAAQAEAQRLATLLNREFAVFQEVSVALPLAAQQSEAA